MKPIPDGELYAVAEEGQKNLPPTKHARLHAIYYVTGDDKDDERRMLQSLSGRNQGKFQQVKAKGAGDAKKDDDKKKPHKR